MFAQVRRPRQAKFCGSGGAESQPTLPTEIAGTIIFALAIFMSITSLGSIPIPRCPGSMNQFRYMN